MHQCISGMDTENIHFTVHTPEEFGVLSPTTTKFGDSLQNRRTNIQIKYLTSI